MLQVVGGLLERAAVPQAAVLVAEQDQLARRAEPGGGPAVLDGEQRGQAPGLRLLREAGRDHPGQPDRVGTEVAVVGAPGRGDEGLVVHHVDHREDVGQPLLEAVGDAQVDAGRDDLALGADDPLGERLLVDEERARDLRCGETDDRAQGERQPGLRREGRVAAGEQEGEPVVGGRYAVISLARRGLGEQLGRPLASASGAEQVHGVALSGGGQPGARPVRRTVAAPARQCLDDRALHRLLGDVEVAEAAVQGGHQPARLLADRAGQQIVARGHSNWL